MEAGRRGDNMAERRPVKSRSRRDKENEIFSELSSLLPEDLVQDTKPDKLSVLRMTVAYIKCRSNLETDSPDLTECLAPDSEEDGPPPQDTSPPLAMLDNEGNVVAGTLGSLKNVVSDTDISLPDSVLSKLEQTFLREDPGTPVDVDQRYERLQKYKEGLERGMKEFLCQTLGEANESVKNKTQDVTSGKQKSSKRTIKNPSVVPVYEEKNTRMLGGFHVEQSLISKEGSLMLEALPGFFLILDRSKRVVFISPNVGELLGFSHSNIIGQDISEFIFDKDYHEIERHMCDEQFQEDKNKGVKAWCLKRTFYLAMKYCFQKPGSRHKKCGYKLFRWNAKLRLFRDKSSGDIKVKGLLSLCRPVRSDVLPELQRSESMFYTRHTLDYKCVYCDPRVEELLGYQPTKILDTDGFQLKHPCDVLMCVYKHKSVVVQGKGDSGYYRLLTKNGRWQWALSQYTIVYDRNGQPLHVDVYTYTISVEEAHCVLSREKKDYERMKCQGFDFDLTTYGLAKPTLASIAAGRELKRQKVSHQYTSSSISVRCKQTISGSKPTTSSDIASSSSLVSSFSPGSPDAPISADLTHAVTDRWPSFNENTSNVLLEMDVSSGGMNSYLSITSHQEGHVDSMSKSSPDSGIDAGSDTEVPNLVIPSLKYNIKTNTEVSLTMNELDKSSSNFQNKTKSANQDTPFFNENDDDWLDLSETDLSQGEGHSSVFDKLPVDDDIDFNISSIVSVDISSPLLDIDLLLSDEEMPDSELSIPSIPAPEASPMNLPPIRRTPSPPLNISPIPATESPPMIVPTIQAPNSPPLNLPSASTTQTSPPSIPSSPSTISSLCGDYEVQSILDFFVPEKTGVNLKSIQFPKSPSFEIVQSSACGAAPILKDKIPLSTTSYNDDLSIHSQSTCFSRSGKDAAINQRRFNVPTVEMDLNAGRTFQQTLLSSAEDADIQPFKCPDIIFEINQSVGNKQSQRISFIDPNKRPLNKGSSSDVHIYHTTNISACGSSANTQVRQQCVSSKSYSARKKLRGSDVPINVKLQPLACTGFRNDELIKTLNDIGNLPNDLCTESSEDACGVQFSCQYSHKKDSSFVTRTAVGDISRGNEELREKMCSQSSDIDGGLKTARGNENTISCFGANMVQDMNTNNIPLTLSPELRSCHAVDSHQVSQPTLNQSSQLSCSGGNSDVNIDQTTSLSTHTFKKSRTCDYNQRVPDILNSSLGTNTYSNVHHPRDPIANKDQVSTIGLSPSHTDGSDLSYFPRLLDGSGSQVHEDHIERPSCWPQNSSSVFELSQTVQPDSNNPMLADDLKDLNLDFSTIESELTKFGVDLNDYV